MRMRSHSKFASDIAEDCLRDDEIISDIRYRILVIHAASDLRGGGPII